MSKSIAEIFIEEAVKTESCNFVEIYKRLCQPRTVRLLHASMGLSTEANEFLDALKKWIFYGKELDIVNIKEELGDANWYEAIAHHELGSSFEEVMTMIIKKLRKRYGGTSFNEEGAINRDVSIERKILERNVKKSITDGLGNVHLSLDCGISAPCGIDDLYTRNYSDYIKDVTCPICICSHEGKLW